MTDQTDEGSSSPANLAASLRISGFAAALGDSHNPAPVLIVGGLSRQQDPDRVGDGGLERSPQKEREKDYVAFDRHELSEILRVYGRMVALGEWRDYAIDHLNDRAVFSIFRRASEVPLYRVEKTPKNARRQGAYSVIAQSGMILKRGSELPRVLQVLDKARLRLAD